MDADSFPRINRVILTGYIQQDPELRFTPGGIPVASFRMRIARLLPENRGAKETVSYITVVAWQDLAQKVSRDGKNGQGIAVEGFLHSRTFSTARNERRTAIEVYADSLQLVPVFVPPTADAGAARSPEPRPREPRAPGRGPRGPRRGADGRPEERGSDGAADEPTLPFTGEGPYSREGSFTREGEFAPENEPRERTERSDSQTDGAIDDSRGHMGEGETGFPH